MKAKEIERMSKDLRQSLFNYLDSEYDVTLLDSGLDDLIGIFKEHKATTKQSNGTKEYLDAKYCIENESEYDPRLVSDARNFVRGYGKEEIANCTTGETNTITGEHFCGAYQEFCKFIPDCGTKLLLAKGITPDCIKSKP